MSVVTHDQMALRLARRPAVRLAVLAPMAATAIYVTVSGRIVDLELFIALAMTATLLASVTTIAPWDDRDGRDAATLPAANLWLTVSGTVGVALLAPFLVLAVEVEVQRFAPLIAVVLVAGAYSYPVRLRLPLAAWALTVWMVTLVWSGVRDVPVLLLHLGGGVLVAVATSQVADGLTASLGEVAARRRDAERRAGLLTTVLSMNSLDPDDVLRGVVRGLMETGLDLALIRSIDHGRRSATLVDGVALGDRQLPRVLPLDDGVLSECVTEQQPIVLDDLESDPRALPSDVGIHGAVLIPLQVDGTVVAVAVGASMRGALTEEQVETADLMAEQAGRALARAQAFEADRETVSELRQLDVRTQDFVSTVSHELRTPLTVVHGLGQTLLTRWDELDPERREDLLRRVDANASRLATMVRSLIDSSEFEDGDLVVEPASVALREVVIALMHRLALVIAAHPASVRIPADLRVRFDPNLLEHVLENLLGNVAKHTPPGTSVEVAAEVADDRAVVSITDRGPGIASADLPHVLERFYRGGEPDRRTAGGLGLGLALAKQVVEAHGSELRLQSIEGEGTRFSFEVPVAR